MKESEYIIKTIASIITPIFISLIVIIGLVKECTDDTDPLDRNNFTAKQEYVSMFDVYDSNHNGFRITYSTVNYVTPERLAEIKSRKHIQDAFNRLSEEAPKYFNDNLLDTDIYDFAIFAKKYDVDKDIQIHCIFVTGPQKVALYAQNNPNIKNCATWINPNTEQGVQWINNSDIYRGTDVEKRTYRYWKCSSIHEISNTDERFAHFFKDEMIW